MRVLACSAIYNRSIPKTVKINNSYKEHDYFQDNRINNSFFTYSFKSLLFPNIFKRKETDYLNYIQTTVDTPETFKSNLLSFLNDDNKRNDFISSLISNPKKSKSIVKTLVSKLGGNDKFLEWYFAEDGYVKNYEKFLEQKYKEAKSIDELLKIHPNWGYWALERKSCELEGITNETDQNKLMRDRNVNFTFGNVPETFGDKYKFNSLVNRLKSFPYMAQNEKYSCNSQDMNVSQLAGGDLSSKNIFKVTDENNNSYIIKMDRLYPEEILKIWQKNPYESRLAKENKLLRGDSVYLNACIDNYLQLNGCNINAKLLYYDFQNNAALYEYVENNETEHSSEHNLIGQIEANNELKELNDLGMFLNDIDTNYNYLKDKNNNKRVIDVGHSEFIDILKPGAKLLTIETVNLSGFSIKNALAGLNVSSVEKVAKGEDENNSLSFRENSFDYELFMEEKKYIKSTLKRNIERKQYKYGKNSQETIQARIMLLEFYKRNIIARNAGYADNSSHIIHGIIHAMEREINEFSDDSTNKETTAIINSYKNFINNIREAENAN